MYLSLLFGYCVASRDWSRFRSSLFGVLAGLLCLPGGVFAQSEATVELSPLVAKSTILSPVDAGKEISVVLVLPLRDLKGATEFAQRVSTPNDELHGKFLTPEQFAAAYGADESDYAALKRWASDNGLKISSESIARTNLTVRGSTSQFEALFNTRINNYRSPRGDTFYSAASKPIIPNAISSRVTGVIGLTSSKQFAPLFHVSKRFGETPSTVTTDASGTGPGGAYNAADLRNAYVVPPQIGGAAAWTVAVFEQGGFSPSDVRKYLKNNALPSPTVEAIGVNGSGTGVNDPNVELEAVLDIDMIIGINPAVQGVLVYEDADDPFPVALLDGITAVANDNRAQVLSMSYGQDEALQGSSAIQAENQVFTQLAAQGITVVASAGDQGAYGDENNGKLNVEDPASQPFVTSIGGTTLFTYGGYYSLEEVWNLLASRVGATGGGISSVWPIPSWQATAPVNLNGGSTTMRNVPDLAAVGNPETGVAVYSYINGGWIEIGGTSVSAPIWASYLSIMSPGHEAIGLGKYGFLNPILYTASSSFAQLHDIVNGNNGDVSDYGIPGYTSGPGYDNCTGWGSPDALTPLWLITLPSSNTGTYPGPFGGLSVKPGTTTAKASWSTSKGAKGYLVEIPLKYSAVAHSEFNLYFATTKTTCEITGLQPKKNYALTVFAVSDLGITQPYGQGLQFRTK
jgi:subtilase family serine protease